MDIHNLIGKEPLIEYPWRSEVDKLLDWASEKDAHVSAFCFDVVMSLAYIDATAGLEQHIQLCDSAPTPYNSHLSFINLCSPCYEKKDIWIYQKAAKPQSGMLGKLSSEVILRFILKYSKNLKRVASIGGTEVADAILFHNDGTVILAEVKSAPLITYPILFNVSGVDVVPHKSVTITSSQLRNAESALYMHNNFILPLSYVGADLWPFKAAIDFLINPDNFEFVSNCVATWLKAKIAYQTRDKNSKMYYLSNASGQPPAIARIRDNWPARESISDSKTSAGMDRTDDIKKGIYQVLKIGAKYKDSNPKIKTALISNLPAYRHGEEYIKPFLDMLWGHESEVENLYGINVIKRSDLRYVFDYIITLEDAILRDFHL